MLQIRINNSSIMVVNHIHSLDLHRVQLVIHLSSPAIRVAIRLSSPDIRLSSPAIHLRAAASNPAMVAAMLLLKQKVSNSMMKVFDVALFERSMQF